MHSSVDLFRSNSIIATSYATTYVALYGKFNMELIQSVEIAEHKCNIINYVSSNRKIIHSTNLETKLLLYKAYL